MSPLLTKDYLSSTIERAICHAGGVSVDNVLLSIQCEMYRSLS